MSPFYIVSSSSILTQAYEEATANSSGSSDKRASVVMAPAGDGMLNIQGELEKLFTAAISQSYPQLVSSNVSLPQVVVAPTLPKCNNTFVINFFYWINKNSTAWTINVY